MTTASRPPLARILAVDAAVRGGTYPNAVSLAAELEVDQRTVQRDVEFMRDRLGAPLVYCRKNNGYTYETTDFRLPFVHLSEGELFALMLADGIMRQYRGTPWEADLSRAVRRLTALLPEGISLNLGDLAEGFSVTPPAVTPQNPEIFAALTRAVRGRERLTIAYRTAARGKPRERMVDPYHLATIGEDCYLLAHCHSRGEVRMFATPRVSRAEPTGEIFDRPAGFDAAVYLAGNFRAIRGRAGQIYEVALRFTPEFAGRIAEKRWHPSQRAEPQPDGTLLLHFTLSDLTEIANWTLSWGRHCQVLAPDELRRRVAEEAAAMLQFYDSSTREPQEPAPEH